MAVLGHNRHVTGMPTLLHDGTRIGRHGTGLSRPPHCGMEIWPVYAQVCPDLYIAMLGLTGVGTGTPLLPSCSLGTEHAWEQVGLGFYVDGLECGRSGNGDAQATKSCHWTGQTCQ